MAMARQLYELQSIELEVEATEKALLQKEAMQGKNRELLEAKQRQQVVAQRLEELKNQQKVAEWDIEDITDKLSKVQQDLYSGRITNPKELAGLQHEAEGFKNRRNILEEKDLEIMEQAEVASAELAKLNRQLAVVEDKWKAWQKQIAIDIGQLQSSLAELKKQRQQTAVAIPAETLEGYNRLRRQKGLAVARVEQGTCRGCGLSLSTAELQRAKGSQLVMCSSCGRILFID
jgi:predicted  nucleic acid-binding Zn-ribbon protein